MEIEKDFFSRETQEVAKSLLGCTIEKDGIRARIVETEAYLKDDPASHCHPEKTERNSLMYETYGHVYVYLCYGLHHMLNFTAEEKGVGGILIRALEPVEGVDKMKERRGTEEKEKLCNGPGKICEALGIDKEINGTEVGEELKLYSGEAEGIEISTRIGISKAVDRELRFFEPGNPHVSDR